MICSLPQRKKGHISVTERVMDKADLLDSVYLFSKKHLRRFLRQRQLKTLSCQEIQGKVFSWRSSCFRAWRSVSQSPVILQGTALEPVPFDGFKIELDKGSIVE